MLFDAPQMLRAKVGWIAYDIANSAYAAVVPSIVFPLLWVTQDPGGDAKWGIVAASGSLLSGILSPICGAAIDRSNNRRNVVIVLAVLTSLVVALFALWMPRSALMIAAAFIAVNVTFNLSVSSYDSLLSWIAKPGRRAILSAQAWGLGYLGGMLVLGVMLSIDTAQEHIVFRTGLALSAALLTVGSLILARSLPGKYEDSIEAPLVMLPPNRTRRANVLLMVSALLALDGITGLMLFAAVYAKQTLALSLSQTMQLLLITHVVAFPLTVASGYLTRRISLAVLLSCCLAAWVISSIALATSASFQEYAFVAAVNGGLIGVTQSSFRSAVAEVTPAIRSGQAMGWLAFVGRAGGILGPLAFGFVSGITGSQRLAVASLAVFFLASIICLTLSGLRSFEAAQKRS